jgi:P4 family phage/plasmid primase-like protien
MLFEEWTGADRAEKLREFARSRLDDYLPTQNMAGLLQTLKAANKEYCVPRLPDEELHKIIRDVLKNRSLKPDDYSDLGQAAVLVKEYGGVLRYSRQTGFLFYDGKRWRADDLTAQECAQKLTDKQMSEARRELASARKKLDDLVEAGADKDEINAAKLKLIEATDFRKFVLSRRASNRITAALKEVQPKVQVSVSDLDRDGYLLNTPSGTVDLRSGEMLPHDPANYCTMMTAVSPDNHNVDVFRGFLEQITCGDMELQEYLQETAGVACMGLVTREELIVAVGSGGNGKSTHYGVLQKVMGDYSTTISPDVLMSSRGQGQQKRFELADLRGRRLVLAPELDAGQTLDSGMMKRACSIEKIRAEKKHRDGFEFTPSHHIVLFTNNMPTVNARDLGTWDRLVVIPFGARFRNGKGEVKDYANYLFKKCGGAILSWMIEGAKRVIDNDFKIKTPACVKAAVEQYKADNDWLHDFVSDCCYLDPTYTATAGDLYREYQAFCDGTGNRRHSQADFKAALESAGFERRATKTGKIWRGLRLKVS